MDARIRRMNSRIDRKSLSIVVGQIEFGGVSAVDLDRRAALYSDPGLVVLNHRRGPTIDKASRLTGHINATVAARGAISIVPVGPMK
jgi:hypothetical protein